jgi:protein involved in polysaccharide export with SLBB domain/TolA-binding protein
VYHPGHQFNLRRSAPKHAHLALLTIKLVKLMKKLLFAGIFSFLVLAAFNCVLAQTAGSSPDVKAVEKSSAVVSSPTDDPNHSEPASEAAGNASAKNHTTSGATAESTSAAPPKAALEAQKNYDTGLALYNSGKLAEAIDAFKESNKLKPNDASTQYMLGMAYWKSKSYVQAVDSFKRAVKTKPDWDEAYFRLGLTYYVLGRTNQSSETYKKLLELNSNLAAKLARIIGEPNASAAANVKAAPKPVTMKPVEIVPVSVSVSVPAAAPANEKPSAPIGDATSTTASSARTPQPIVATSTEKPNATTGDANPATPIASSPEPAITTAPVTVAKAPVADDLPLTDIYRVGVGDVLDVRLLNSAANHSTLYSVIDGGLLDFPIAGAPIPVAGLTTKEIQARISSELKRLAVADQAQVAVGVRQYGSHTVVVTGLVGSPGTKVLRREAVPLYVLLAEIQPRLDAARVTIMRSGAAPQTLDLNDSAALNFIVCPGDVINLTARQQDFYYIAGHTIGYPGQKAFQPGITLVQAILAAGGLARDGAVELSREGVDGHLATTKLNLKEIKSGKIQDPKLQPGDRIEVLH